MTFVFVLPVTDKARELFLAGLFRVSSCSVGLRKFSTPNLNLQKRRWRLWETTITQSRFRCWKLQGNVGLELAIADVHGLLSGDFLNLLQLNGQQSFSR